MNKLSNRITPAQKRCTVLKKYVYREEDVEFPNEIMYDDWLCLFPSEKVTLDKWNVSKQICHVLRDEFTVSLKYLSLNRCLGLSESRMECFTTLANLNVLHLKGVITIDVPVATIIGRLSRIYELDISENKVGAKAFHQIFSRLQMLKYLYCNGCKGIDDFSMQNIADCVSRFRKLSHIYLANNHDYSDEGMLALVTVGPNVIIELDISGNTNITTLSMAGVRKTMCSLRSLNLSNVRGSGQSAYEFIAEGCIFLTELDIHKSPTVNDAALIMIGRKLKILKKLDVSECYNVTDTGICGFVEEFQGRLEWINISGCVQCGGPSAFALSGVSQHIHTIKLNCLSMITMASMKALWKNLSEVEEFEMSADIKSSGTHRRSMIPHISDDVVTSNKMETLKSLKVCGACQITDIGAIYIAKNSPKLIKVDFSHCNAIGDKALVALGQYSPQLKYAILVGLSHMTDVGLKALCLGCKQLVTLDCNGCAGISDYGAKEIGRLKVLESLTLSSCDYVTDESIVEIGRNCLRLRILNLNNMDMVTKISIAYLTRYCTNLVKLSCLICNIVPEEFQSCCKYLPMAKPLAKCQLGPRNQVVMAHNQYVDAFNSKSLECVNLQRFLRGWMQKLKFQRYLTLREQSALLMQRFYRGCVGRVLANDAKKAKRALAKNARRLQKCMKKLVARRMNRWKLVNKIKVLKATALLQRFSRGFLCRKRLHYRAVREGGKKMRIFFIAQLYRVILECRHVHRCVVIVQCAIRRYLCQKRFRIMSRGFKSFLRICNIHLSANYTIDIVSEELIAYQAEREYAALKIAIWAEAIVFNRAIVDFVMECGIWFRNDLDTAEWIKVKRIESARLIQARARGMLTRKHLLAEKLAREMGYFSSVMIAKNLRRFVAMKKYKKWRQHMKRISALWRRLYRAGMDYYYSYFASIIQRSFRLHLFLKKRRQAGATINRLARGHLGRNKRRRIIEGRQKGYCILVQRKFRAFRRRKQRYILFCKQYIAARRIQVVTREYLRREREKRRIAEERRAAYMKLQQEKLEVMHKRKLRVIEKIMNTSKHRYASRIQRSWRKYFKEKQAKMEAEKARRKVMQDLKAENEKTKFSLSSVLPNPKAGVKRAVKKMRNILKEDKVKDEDKPLYMVSVMKYQTQSITQVGIIDIAMTFGEGETNAFQLHQNFLRSTKRRYFVMLEGDLSGHLSLSMHLWVMKGSGSECICKLEVKEKPKNSSLAAIRNRVAQKRINGINIAWNEKVHIEVHGICSLKRRENGFAVDGIRICHNAEMATEALDDGYHLVADLADFSLPTSLWFHGKTQAPDESAFKLSVLESQDWFDERLRKSCLKFNLSESDVFQMKLTFDAINKGKFSFEIRTQDMFRYFKFPVINIGIWLVEAIEPRDKYNLTFSEYVHLVSFFCCFGELEKLRFLFGRNCTKSHQTMTKEQFETTLECLTEGFTGQRNMVRWVRAFDKHCNPKLKLMFFSDFEGFFKSNPRAQWGFNELQTKFMQYNIGRNYWETKCENFTHIRKGLGFVST